MEQCWDADPSKRPNVYDLLYKIREVRKAYIQNLPNEANKNKSMAKKLTEIFKRFPSSEVEANNSIEIEKTKTRSETSYVTISTSKVYRFENLPEPRNATEGNDI